MSYYVDFGGNLTADPELRFISNGSPVARLRVASTHRFRNRRTGEYQEEPTKYTNVEVWNQAAENIAESLSRGDAVRVRGRLRVREFEDREGNVRTTEEVVDATVSVDMRFQTATVQRVRKQQAGNNEAPASPPAIQTQPVPQQAAPAQQPVQQQPVQEVAPAQPAPQPGAIPPPAGDGLLSGQFY